ncbi:MAG: YncE family protein [Thermomicrobiales bacterium]
MLSLTGYVDLPAHAEGGFDHGDVHRATGRVFVAHTANGTVEVIDAAASRHIATLPDCPEASGVLCAQEAGLVFAAARANGRVLVIDPLTRQVTAILDAGQRPNGLAWDSQRQRLLVADVGDNQARLVDLTAATVVVIIELPGRPRWCVYDPNADMFFINIREPALVVKLDAATGSRISAYGVASAGPHGLDLDERQRRLFVACDGGQVVILDADGGEELGIVPIPGVPDAIWFDAAREFLFVAIGEPGVLTVVDTAAGTVAEEIITEPGAQTTAFDPVRQRLYVFLPRTCRAAVYQVEEKPG